MTKNDTIVSLCATVGASAAVLSDLLVKGDASVILNAGRALQQVAPIKFAPLLLVVAILVFAFFAPWILEVTTKKKAFYAGVGILATVFTAVPYTTPPALSTTPNSSLVTLTIAAGETRRMSITVSVVNRKTGETRQSTYEVDTARAASFYLDEGSYAVTVKCRGFRIVTRNIEVGNDDAPLTIPINLRRTVVPLNLQQLF